LAWTNREDLVTSAVIDRALQMLATDGELFAWSHLADHGLSASAIARILAGRHRERESAQEVRAH